MKKHLLSTSALVAAGMIAGAGTGMVVGSDAAQAQSAPASSPIQITVGGYMRQYFGYSDNDNVNPGGLSTASTTTAKQSKLRSESDTEIYFAGKTTLANGISVAVRVELEGNTSTDQIDESFVAIEGAFGRLEMGSTDGAQMKTNVSAPVWGQFGALDLGSGFSVNATRSSALINSGAGYPLQLMDDDANKLSYYTPRFEGFQLGVSYTPEIAQDRVGGAFQHTDSYTYNKMLSAGLNFTRAFGAFDVQASAGYSTAKKPAETTVSDPEAYGFGLQVGYAGFRVGGNWAEVQDQQTQTGQAAGFGSGSTFTSPATFVDMYNHGTQWSLGGTYTFGPATVGIRYTEVQNRGSTALTADDEWEQVQVGGAYTLGPGVSVGASLFYLRSKGEGTSVVAGQDLDNNKSAGIIGGLLLNF
jgi:hypothetical protein